MESWLPIVGYEGKYAVSDFGNVRNAKTGRIMKLSPNKDGYLHTILSNKGRKTCSVHRLVLETFLPTDGKEVNHKNHIKTDNRLENLEWCSRSENLRFRKKREGLSSQYIGVCWFKRDKKWHATCRLNGKKIYLGTFDTEEEGAKAYNVFIIKHDLQHFTKLNEIS
jgi:hypothetical protein